MALNAAYVPITHLQGKFLQKFMGPQMVTDNGGPNIGRVHDESIRSVSVLRKVLTWHDKKMGN